MLIDDCRSSASTAEEEALDPVLNPFAPGAGSPPPELAGRAIIVEEATVQLQRAIAGRQARPHMLLGLRGVGKTVLLSKIEDLAKVATHETSLIESPEDAALSSMLVPKINQALRRFSLVEAAKEQVHAAVRALRSFASAFKVGYGEISISVDPEIGVADSGDIEEDVSELFVRVGEAARAAGKGWTLLIDEVQYLNSKDLAALIVALHKVSQKQLPVLFFGAGLPQVAALSGDAKSYAERLFTYPSVGALESSDARKAITQPLATEGKSISDEALDEIIAQTRGYPYFLQEWGYQCWNISAGPEITLDEARRAAEVATRRLDEGFFKVRFDRLTPKEREYVIAMARLGSGPYASSAVAAELGQTTQQLGPCRAGIIKKGMIYSPSHGGIAFTVPMFDEYVTRNYPDGSE
jgi:hypothetical protein